MFQKILVPTDGSKLATKAVDFAIRFAQKSGSKVVGLCVAEPYPYDLRPESGAASYANIYGDRMRELAISHVDAIAEAARAAGVPCETHVTVSFSPHDEIVKAVAQFHCDAIFMASHGRKGLDKLLLGSETQKVLAHATVPVLVLR
jgi:nucleotide-binding universal stress UspA family protein